MEDMQLFQVFRQIIKEEIAPLKAELTDFKKETALNFHNIDKRLKEAEAARIKLGEQITTVDEHVTEVADTLEGGLNILDKVEQRLNPVADYVESLLYPTTKQSNDT